jgi:hypothetical protein
VGRTRTKRERGGFGGTEGLIENLIKKKNWRKSNDKSGNNWKKLSKKKKEKEGE